MISFFKKNLFKLVLAGLLSIFLGLNYFGLCYSQKRFLSDEEKRNLVIDYIIRTEKANFEYFQSIKAMNESDGYRRYIEKNLDDEPIPYRDIEEFLALNPNCCQVTTNYKSIGGEGDTVSCWNRLIGFKSSVVGIRYLKRYRDNKGIIQTKRLEIFPGISNCGELVWELG